MRISFELAKFKIESEFINIDLEEVAYEVECTPEELEAQLAALKNFVEKLFAQQDVISDQF